MCETDSKFKRGAFSRPCVYCFCIRTCEQLCPCIMECGCGCTYFYRLITKYFISEKDNIPQSFQHLHVMK